MYRRIRLFAKPLPFTCLLLTCVIITTYIFDEWIQLNVISADLALDAIKVAYEGEIWRLYTSFFTHSSILLLSLSIYLLIIEGGAFENRIGSITYMILFTLKHFLVAVLYCGIFFVLYSTTGYSRGIGCGGAWMVILSDLISRTFANPDELRICRTITNRVYSTLLLVLSFILSDFGVQVFAIIGIAAIEFYAFNGLMVRPRRSWIVWVEKHTCAFIAKKALFFSFVSVEECNISFFKIESSDRIDDLELQSGQDHEDEDADDRDADDQNHQSADEKHLNGDQSDFEAQASNRKHASARQSQQQKQNNMSFYDGNTQSGKLAMEQTYFSKAGYSHSTKNNGEDCLENIDEDIHTDVEDVQQQRNSIYTEAEEEEEVGKDSQSHL